jgi:uncharacterized protein (DUF1778 family)
MGKASTRATNKYNKKAYDRISLVVPKGEREKIRKAAEAVGESVNRYVNRAIAARMEGKNEEG